MTNAEKALEIVNTSTLRDSVDGFGIALKMARWKDKQFHETLKRANESITKAYEEGAKIERERILKKVVELLTDNPTNYASCDNKEEKDLLFKDICSRLPYSVL